MSRPYISVELRQQVIEDAGYSCGYCLSDEVLMGVSLTFEHIIPVSAGGLTTRDNLWRSCRQCNENKAAKIHGIDPETKELVPLFNPRIQSWSEHLTWDMEYTHIIGITPSGRATVDALQLNRTLLVRARQRWSMMGWIPVSEIENEGAE